MSRVLVIPAAGIGTRLGGTPPKLLSPVLGRPMLDYLLELYTPWVERVFVVVQPAFEEVVTRHCAQSAAPVEVALQAEPTGMLDALLAPLERVRALAPTRVWATWCDQVAVRPETVKALASHEDAALVLPTLTRPEPYVHLERDDAGRITAVRHRREGDSMPASGESDMGLFAFSARAYLEWLPAFAREARADGGTGERNFLHFLPWLARRERIESFPGQHEIEALGINTPEDRARVEAHLRDT